jgi:hypothetical protein
MVSSTAKITAGVKNGASNIFKPPWRDLYIILLPGDERYVLLSVDDPLEIHKRGGRGRQAWRLQANQ